MATMALPNLRNLLVCEDIRRTYSDFTRDGKQGQDRCPRTSPLLFQVVKTETTKKTAIERLVKPPERMAPKGDGKRSTSGERSRRIADWPAPSTADNKSCRKEPAPAAIFDRQTPRCPERVHRTSRHHQYGKEREHKPSQNNVGRANVSVHVPEANYAQASRGRSNQPSGKQTLPRCVNHRDEHALVKVWP